jgi:isocitrate/isopropylmalate dehydrogenase
MMPEDWKQKIGKHDAIYFGAVGWPAKIPDHVSLWGSLIKFRREFDQYVNLRPVRLMPGVPSPLANRKPGDIDFWVVREKHRRRVFIRRRADVPGQRARIRHPANGDDPHRRRSHPEIRV